MTGFVPPASVATRLPEAFDPIWTAAHYLTGPEIETWARTKEPQALWITSAQRMDAACINKLPKSVRIIATMSVGFEHIDLEAAKKRGIVVTHTPDVLSNATADLTLMLLLNACRRGHEYFEIVRRGWLERVPPGDILGQDLNGKTLGIIGLGRIGRAVAQRARGFGMSIAYHNRNRLDKTLEAGARFCKSLDELLQDSHVVSLHVPATPQTKHLINAKTLAKMRPHSVLINVARGDCVDEAALIDALKSGHLFAAGLDVFAQEPRGNPELMKMRQVFATPHCASATQETRFLMCRTNLEDIQAVINGEKPKHPVPGSI